MTQKNQLTIETLSDELRGITKVDGKTHFVRGALVGEIVHFVQTRRKSSWAEGYASEVLHAHPERITPPCTKADALNDPHPCGGCSLQHMPLAMQRQEKEQVVKRLLAPYAATDVWQEALVAEDLGYRQKARLGVRYNKKARKVHVGFREARSHFIADITRCPVLDTRVGAHLQEIAEVIAQTTIPDAIPQIEVAMGDEACALVIRHLRPLTEQDQTILIALAKQHNWHLWLQPSNYQSAQQIYPTTHTTLLSYQHPDFAARLFFHPLDFTQVHANINRLLVKRALNWLSLHDQAVVFDLFSGIGNFAIPLATVARNVYAFDNDAMLLERCQTNARHNGRTVIPHQLDLFGEQDCEQLTQLIAEHTPHAVVVDPPRTGCDLVVRALVQHSCVKQLLYVSCNPHTLARDVATVVGHGFAAKKVAIADMFPHTHHVETICLLTRT